MTEAEVRSCVVSMLRPLSAFAVENAVHDGCPDVCCVAGWIELKLARWPTRHSSVVQVDLRPSQRVWLKRWRMLRGRAWTLTVVSDQDWLLHDGAWASDNLGNVVADVLRDKALAVWPSKPDSRDLINALVHTAR